ncbi:hypothetical protein O181_075768, partial [Austropuccinia psidii MF-1]|nr:hypothetical protein [Austropuccinia psidii MF-1]
TPVLLIIVVAVPIILVISCPPFRSKDLLHVCKNTLQPDATVPVTNKWNKANSEVISIISSRVSHRVFIEVVKKYSRNAQQLWIKLEEQYASKKAINRVPLLHSPGQALRQSQNPPICGVLSLNEELIQQPKLVLERLQEFHDNSKVQSSNHNSTPLALVSESAHPYKITYFCTNGKHNPMCTTHTKEACFAENPHLRPTQRANKRKTRSYQNPTAHLSTTQVLVTGEISSEKPEELIIDCGSTHHMFNSRKRANRTILDKTRCLINSSGLPNHYWAEALNTAVLLSNLITTPSRFNLSPYSLWTGNPPRIKKLRVFGFCAVVSIPRSHQDWKLGPAGETGVLLGYENDNSSYRVLRLSDRKVLISKHVRFDESHFPFVHSPLSTEKSTGHSDDLAVCNMNETPHLDSVEAVDEPHLTEVVEAEAIDEICSANPDCNSRRVDESRLLSGDLNT